MMKMLENANGNTMSINAGEYQHLEFSFDMSSTNVEDMNDLEVALWLQDFNTKKVYNSRFAYEYTDHAYPVQNHTMTANGNDLVITWEAPEAGTPTGYMVKVNGEVKEANTTNMTYTIANAEGLQIAEVIALYGDKTSVPTVTSSDNNGDDDGDDDDAIEELNNSFVIYPNPVKDVLTVKGENMKQVVISNALGQVVETINTNDNEVRVDVSAFNNGMYFINVIDNNGEMTTSKVSVLH